MPKVVDLFPYSLPSFFFLCFFLLVPFGNLETGLMLTKDTPQVIKFILGEDVERI